MLSCSCIVLLSYCLVCRSRLSPTKPQFRPLYTAAEPGNLCCCIVVLLYCFCIVLLLCCFVVVLYCCLLVLLFYCPRCHFRLSVVNCVCEALYCCCAVLLLYCIIVCLYCCFIVLSVMFGQILDHVSVSTVLHSCAAR